MSLEIEGSFPPIPKRDGSDGFLNGHDCPHCGIWFRLDEAKPVEKDTVRCPNCDWPIEGL